MLDIKSVDRIQSLVVSLVFYVGKQKFTEYLLREGHKIPKISHETIISIVRMVDIG